MASFLVVTPIAGQSVEDAGAMHLEGGDRHQWLEDVHGEAPLAWVREQNEVALSELKGDPFYDADYDAILALLDAEDRIAMGSLRGSDVFNFWRDSDNPRGLWRRTSIESYETATPEWEVLLDVDATAEAEDQNWVFKGAACAPELTRCLLSLSPGGGDAVVVREFDLTTRSFVEDGFFLAEAKSDAAYLDTDTVLFASDFGEGSLTASGYPRIVKRWRRGQSIDDAMTVYEGTVEDVGAWPAVLEAPDGSTALVTRAVSFFETEYFHVEADGSTRKLPLPLSADVKGMTGGQLVATLRKEWTPEGGSPIAQGALIAVSLDQLLRDGGAAISVLHTPSLRAAVESVAPGRDAVYAAIFENVIGSMHVFHYDETNGTWDRRVLSLPQGGSTGVVSANAYGPEALFRYESFLMPTTLFRDRGDGAPAAIKSLPPRFDSEGSVSAQYEATSKDGTKIPYFIVRPEDESGPMPTLLYGYGGFENALTPWYWASAGKVWAAKGGAYAVANIRGGGEFGPAWHEAALKTNRQRAFDDFIAVAEDMVARGLTTPKMLGIQGGSNGGLLVGAVAMQRPDLFTAVVCQVPLLDMIRYMQMGAGASWEGEYGNPANADERAALLSYSPYHNVHGWQHYPKMFFVTATSDDRVSPVHARKMAAKMAEQGHDFLFYENTDGGHAAAANNAQAAEMSALAYTFLARELGLGAGVQD